ncbi:hypothetical protein CR513_13228, partial [Mucuna pruriens]
MANNHYDNDSSGTEHYPTQLNTQHIQLELYQDLLVKEPLLLPNLNPSSHNLTTLPLSSVKSCHVCHPFWFSPFLNRNNPSHLFHHSISDPSLSPHAVKNDDPSLAPYRYLGGREGERVGPDGGMGLGFGLGAARGANLPEAECGGEKSDPGP